MKQLRRIALFVFWAGLVSGICFAQTPIPGTPAYVTCFEPGSGGSVVYQVSGWNMNDAFAVVFRPDEGYQPIPSSSYPIRINGIEVGFVAPSTPSESYDEFVISVYWILNEDLLPDLDAAGILLWGGNAMDGGYLIPMPSPAHDMEWILFDFSSFGGPETFPVINGGAFAVKVEYTNYLGINNAIEMDGMTDYGSVCTFYNDTNIYCTSTNNCNFIEDTSLDPGNWLVHVKYDANVEWRVPSTTPWGVALILVLISALLIFRKR